MRILIADDDAVSRTVARHVLESLGYEVTLVSDGDAALKAHQVEPFRLILTDWVMPGVNGLKLIREIRATEKEFYTYIILLTAHGDQREQYLEAMEAGADDFLAKPLNKTELMIRLAVAKRIIEATSRIHSLENMVTICAYTKKVKIPEEGWQTIETFLHRHLGLTLSHGVEPGHYENVIRPQLEAMKTQFQSPS